MNSEGRARWTYYLIKFSGPLVGVKSRTVKSDKRPGAREVESNFILSRHFTRHRREVITTTRGAGGVDAAD